MTIQSGEAVYNFTVDDAEIRGKSFGIPVMYSKFDRLPLGFTTDLGKMWQPWMIYRELWCNAFDEPNARVWVAGEVPRPTAGITRMIVSGPNLAEAHARRDDFILGDRTPLFQTDDVDIFEGPSTRVFYRGIAVRELPRPGLLTYNIKPRITLTEDRTGSEWETNWHIARGLMALKDEQVIKKTLGAGEEDMEFYLDYPKSHGSDNWKAIAREKTEAEPLKVPASVRGMFIEPEISRCSSCGRAF